jgi:hypothetical protein
VHVHVGFFWLKQINGSFGAFDLWAFQFVQVFLFLKQIKSSEMKELSR